MRTITGVVLAAFATLAATVPPAAAGPPGHAAALAWSDCGDGFQCATATVPRDYRRPGGRRIKLALVRLPAQDPASRIGSMFVNPGGPGESGIEFVRNTAKTDLAPLNRRFDLVSWDPRGVGDSAGAVDCAVDQERLGSFAQPFGRPNRASERRVVRMNRRYVRRCVARNARSGLLPYLHTANTARDLNRLRALVGDRKLTYIGFSYGTQIGATYATFFPRRVRALALDGAVNMVSHPIRDLRERAASFEDAFDRFLADCRVTADHCGLGATDPQAAYDGLVKRLNRRPLPAGGSRPVDGDDLLIATYGGMTQKAFWRVLSIALVQAQAGDGTLLRAAVDAFYGPGDDAFFDPFVAISALDGRWPARIERYLRDGRSAYRELEHFWWDTGYSALAMGLWPVEPIGAYFGPIRNSRRATTALVIGTTHDPSTPYVWAKRMTAELGNARLLTMRGYGHTASFNNNTRCIDDAVLAYLERLDLPRRDTACRQEVPF